MTAKLGELKNFFDRIRKPSANGGIVIPFGVKKPTFKVALGICTHRQVYLTVFSLTRILEACPDPKITLAMGVGDALIDRSRSRVATEFLKTDNDILFFIDDDIKVESQDITRMMWEMWKYPEIDILGAPYCLKSDTERAFALRTLEDKTEFAVGKGGEIRQVRYVSSGLMGIKRKVFEKMIEKEVVHLCHPDTQAFYPFFCPMEYKLGQTFLYLSEDWSFCQKAIDLGFKVFSDMGIKTGHIGPHTYTFDDWLRPEKEIKEGFNYRVDVQKE